MASVATTKLILDIDFGETFVDEKGASSQSQKSPETSNAGPPTEGERCRLLELPTELRLLIYSYVIGSHFAHVYADWKDSAGNSGIGSFAHDCKPYPRLKICSWGDRDVETEIYDSCMNIPADEAKAVGESRWTPSPSLPLAFFERHARCLEDPPKARMDLRFLRTCKSIYHDARLLPYSLTTFSFQYPENFDSFIFSAQKDQLAAIKSLHFDVNYHDAMDEWTHALEPDTMKDLVSLKKLFLWIHLEVNGRLGSMGEMQSLQSEIYYKKPVAYFRMCPLREVKVMLNPRVLGLNEHPSWWLFGWEGVVRWSKEFQQRLLIKWEGPIDLLDA
ncbi:hypothetical protein ABW19_dt0209032 [Dactylella cylindrospora]|nr:hypothetical protein ABW19_dt0209032 [Dactylella cylindrospora]